MAVTIQLLKLLYKAQYVTKRVSHYCTTECTTADKITTTSKTVLNTIISWTDKDKCLYTDRQIDSYPSLLHTAPCVYEKTTILKCLLRPKKFLCFLLQSGKKIVETGAEFFILFHFYDKTFRVELAAQECGF